MIHHVILDRDGVLNREDPKGGHVTRPEDWRWETGALEGLHLLAEAGLVLSVVSNQSVIGRGGASAEQIEAVMAEMRAGARQVGARFAEIRICPHAPDAGCRCRKPAPTLVSEVVAATGVPAGETGFVGDSPTDLQAGRAAGVRVALVRTGKGRATEASVADPALAVFDDLHAAARAIVAGRLDERPTGESMAIRDAFDEHGSVFAASASALPDLLEEGLGLLRRALREGGKVLVAGNGGSAADAQHFATELVCRVRRDRRALPAIALTTDTSALTAIGNDHGFEQIFARQVDALAGAGDVLVAISTSGNSGNVIAAARLARERGCSVLALTGRRGGELAGHADLCVKVPSDNVSRIQEIHALCLHALAETLEGELIEESPS